MSYFSPTPHKRNVWSSQITDQQALRRLSAPKPRAAQGSDENEFKIGRSRHSDPSSTPHEQQHRMIRNKEDI
jgi:hypothetical protein